MWTDEPLLALDFETTGLDVLEDRPVSVALLVLDGQGNRLDDSFYKIVDAGVPIPKEASDIHRLTASVVRKNGQPAEQVIAELVDVLRRHDDLPLLIYNAPFDYPFLLAEARRYGLNAERQYILDPLIWSRTFFKYAKGGHSLSVVANRLGIQFVDAHDALADITAAVEVGRILSTHDARLDVSSSELQILQSKWYQRWAVDFEAYLNSRPGRIAESIDPGWPIPTTAQHLLSN